MELCRLIVINEWSINIIVIIIIIFNYITSGTTIVSVLKFYVANLTIFNCIILVLTSLPLQIL